MNYDAQKSYVETYFNQRFSHVKAERLLYLSGPSGSFLSEIPLKGDAVGPERIFLETARMSSSSSRPPTIVSTGKIVDAVRGALDFSLCN